VDKVTTAQEEIVS